MKDVCFKEHPLNMKLSMSKNISLLSSSGGKNFPLNSYIYSLGGWQCITLLSKKTKFSLFLLFFVISIIFLLDFLNFKFVSPSMLLVSI